jgi:gas vesicle protein
MAYQSYDYDQNSGMETGAGFLMGLLSGVVLGIGVGMLLAPRTGAELRHTLAQSASDLQRAASDSLGQVSSKVKETTEKGREALHRTTEHWGEMREGTTPGTTPQTPTAGGGYVS